MSRLGFDLCENCDRLWNEGGGHDVETCPGCDLTTAIQERYKAETERDAQAGARDELAKRIHGYQMAAQEAEVKADRYRATLVEVRHDSSIPWAIDTIAERHEIDPAELKAD